MRACLPPSLIILTEQEIQPIPPALRMILNSNGSLRLPRIMARALDMDDLIQTYVDQYFNHDADSERYDLREAHLAPILHRWTQLHPYLKDGRVGYSILPIVKPSFYRT